MAQEVLNVNVSFEGELAQYLTDMAEIENKTIQEVLVDFVKEEIEARKLDEEDDDGIDEADIALARLAASRNVPGAKRVKYEDVKWR
ncbi:hypothetical protein [Wolbachia endosymbiont (group E) of Neria commutata]|uniref:hypothetical protein n=1 Tax=Wolbachia endosymbiont (group E) of Neria commutata TaxID=3066149 RepID=UPI0031334225